MLSRNGRSAQAHRITLPQTVCVATIVDPTRFANGVGGADA